MKIAVVGTGTAGILSLSFLLAYPTSPIEVYSIHNPKKPILGVGESTSTQIPTTLYDAINFSLLEDSQELDATLKLGVKFSDWREKDFYAHITPVSYGIHFDNQSLKEFAFKRFEELYDNFHIIHGNVDKIESKDNKSLVFLDGDKVAIFDYVIDCGGYPDDYADYNICKYISLNSCLVHNTKPQKFNYTHHRATPNGWMFGIPLQSRQSWGYLYNDTITSKEESVSNFKTYFDDIEESNLKEFKFKSYSAKQFFDGRVLKNGNRAFFYEPIEAFSGFMYQSILKFFCEYLYCGISLEKMNENIGHIANNIELATCFIYHGGSIYDTPYWNYAKNISKEKLNTDIRWSYQVDELKSIKLEYNKQLKRQSIGAYPAKIWLDFEKNLNYNLF